MRNKKVLPILLIAITLGMAAYYVYNKNKNRDTLDKESRDFAYTDTAAITKIFIADKSGKKVTLHENESGVWIVNDKFPARNDGVIAILKALKYLEVKYPVGEKAKKTVIKDLATGAIKAEFYKGNELVKVFYVGGETQDHTGTYMLLVSNDGENFDQPYVMGLPGFEGYLTPRFFVNENDWKDTKCLDFIPPQIASVKMEISKQPDSSFAIQIKDTKNLELMSLDNKPLGFKPDIAAIKQYVAYLQNLHYEKLLTGEKNAEADSVRKTFPFSTLTITEKSGKQNQYLFYFKPIVKGQEQKYGIKSEFDPDRLYMEFNNRKDIAVIQYYVFGKLLQNRSYFVPKAAAVAKGK